MGEKRWDGSDLWNIFGVGLAVIGLSLGILQPGVVVGWVLLAAGVATLGFGAWAAIAHRKQAAVAPAPGSISAGRSIRAGGNISATGQIEAGDSIRAGGDIAAGATEAAKASVFADWARIEDELRSMLANQRDAAGLDDWQLVEAAHDEGVISDATVNNLQGIHVLRRLASHEQERVTAQKAREFNDLVDGVIYAMHNPPAL